MRSKGYFAAAVIIIAVFCASMIQVSAAEDLLKQGMEGSSVTALQKDLKKLGYFSTDITGYYGEVTVNAVKRLQKKYGYDQDGMVGESTNALIKRLLGKTDASKTSSTGVLKKGMEGSSVLQLQKNLKKLSYLSTDVTGYYGDLTEAAVKKLQKKYGYDQDGVAGPGTLALIAKISTSGSSSVKAVKTTSSKSTAKTSYKGKFPLPWSSASKVFAIGRTATVYDIESGLSFRIKRTYGHNHADCETVSARDTSTMKKIFGGSWTWNRKAVIITVGSTKIAASIAGMPHAGVESASANRTVSSRSGSYGRGTNYDSVKGNSMSGHFDVHFLGSRTHGTGRVDPAHQSMVKKAVAWAEDNLR